VTGSHNPPDHNGFKMVMGARPVFGAQIQELGQRAAAEVQGPRRGAVRDVDVFDSYVDRLLHDYDGERPLRVAWDAGNGATGNALVALTAKLPGRHFLLNEKIDGSFPAHHPDPTIPENLVQLQEAVALNNCDLGIGFDGDGDRIGVVDGRGRIIWGDQIIALLARDVLTRNPGATIIADVKASQSLFDDIAAHGGKPLMWKSGHSLLRNKLADAGAPLAGEMSGHIFFAERFYGHDDALYAAVRFVAMAARSRERVARMLDSLPRLVNTPELRLECDDIEKFQIVDRVKRHVIEQGARANDIDGVRVTTADGWWLLRASNTQPMLVARCEAGDEAGLERVKQDLRAALAAVGASLPL
jgi:phosphomannomutase